MGAQLKERTGLHELDEWESLRGRVPARQDEREGEVVRQKRKHLRRQLAERQEGWKDYRVPAEWEDSEGGVVLQQSVQIPGQVQQTVMTCYFYDIDVCTDHGLTSHCNLKNNGVKLSEQ